MNIMGRSRSKLTGDAVRDQRQEWYDEGYRGAERTFCDTIVFQDAYISSLEREVKHLREKLEQYRNDNAEGGKKG